MRIVPKNWPAGVPIPPPVPKRYYDDMRWISEHMRELQERHPNQWVAVVNGEVAAAGKILGEVQQLAEQRTGESEFPVWFVQPDSGYHSHWRVL